MKSVIVHINLQSMWPVIHGQVVYIGDKIGKTLIYSHNKVQYEVQVFKFDCVLKFEEDCIFALVHITLTLKKIHVLFRQKK